MSCKFKLLKIVNEKALYGACEDTQINLLPSANLSETVYNLGVAFQRAKISQKFRLVIQFNWSQITISKITWRLSRDHKFKDVNYALFGAVDVYSRL